MNKKVMKIAALMCSVCIAAAGCEANSNKADKLKKIAVSELEGKDLSTTLKTDGIIESTENDSTVMTDLTGYKVSKVYVSVGDSVKKGDILCELDSTDLEKEIADLEKMINDSSTLYDYQYQQLLKELENTRKSGDLDIQEANDRLQDARNSYNSQRNSYNENRERYNNLLSEAENLRNEANNSEDPEKAEIIMQQYQIKMGEAQSAMAAYEAANNQMQSLSATISAYEKALESAKLSAGSQIDSAQYNVDTYSLTNGSDSENQNRLDELKKDLENTKIRAERDGVVSAVSAEEGKLCRDGILMSLQNASDMCVHVVISEEDLLSVNSGMKATITIPARKDDVYTGVVDRVLDIKSSGGFDSYINIDDTTNFRIGMSAKVEIKTLDAEGVLAVSKKSVFTDDDDETKSYVYEAEKQADDTYKIRKVEIKKGNETGSLVEISGEGLDEGDYIVNSPARCSEDDIVEIRTGR